jgi:hypothetical protein
MRSLVLYYSNTGNTRLVAERLAGELGAQLAEVTCPAYRRFPLLIAWDIFTRRLPRIQLSVPPTGGYDLVVVGGPVWGGRPAPPLLRALADYRNTIGRVGLFVTASGTSPKFPPQRAIDEMATAVSGPVVGTRIFTEREIKSGAWRQQAELFAATLAALPPVEDGEPFSGGSVGKEPRIQPENQ